jgi:hypothetical protein
MNVGLLVSARILTSALHTSSGKRGWAWKDAGRVSRWSHLTSRRCRCLGCASSARTCPPQPQSPAQSEERATQQQQHRGQTQHPHHNKIRAHRQHPPEQTQCAAAWNSGSGGLHIITLSSRSISSSPLSPANSLSRSSSATLFTICGQHGSTTITTTTTKHSTHTCVVSARFLRSSCSCVRSVEPDGVRMSTFASQSWR